MAFIDYDDNREKDPERYYNSRCKREVSNEWKYNLCYIRIDLQSHVVTNFGGDSLNTPIVIDMANAKCRIRGTQGCEAGVPPFIVLDENDPPTIIVHGTEDTTVPFANSEQLIKELEFNNVKSELVGITGAGHTPAGHMDFFAEKIARFLYDLLAGHTSPMDPVINLKR